MVVSKEKKVTPPFSAYCDRISAEGGVHDESFVLCKGKVHDKSFVLCTLPPHLLRFSNISSRVQTTAIMPAFPSILWIQYLLGGVVPHR